MPLQTLVAAQPTKQQLVDYVNAVAVVNNYAYAITNQSLPVLMEPPQNYGEFTTKFAPAKQHALNWTDNVFVLMLQLPQTIQEQAADLFDLESTMIEAYLNALIADPSNTTAKNGLQNALTTLQKVIQQQVTTVDDIQSSLTAFANDIYSDAQVLTAIAQGATDDAGDDQTKITNIQGDIEKLKGQIATAQTLLTVSEIGMGLSIFVGLVGVVVALIPGATGVGIAIIIAAVGGEATSIAGTVIESQAIKAMQGQIDSDKTQISDLHQDIILLNGVSAQFNSLYNANLQAQNALSEIKTMWNSLNDAIGAVSTDLTDVNADNTAAQYQQALSDFKAAEASWADVVTFAAALAGLNFQWQDSSGGAWHSFSSSGPAADSSTVSQIQSTIALAS